MMKIWFGTLYNKSEAQYDKDLKTIPSGLCVCSLSLIYFVQSSPSVQYSLQHDMSSLATQLTDCRLQVLHSVYQAILVTQSKHYENDKEKSVLSVKQQNKINLWMLL